MPNIFTRAEILTPRSGDEKGGFERWAVIACDQHTQSTEYWDEVERIADGGPSAYDYIIPESYLGTEKEAVQEKRFDEHMAALRDGAENMFRKTDGYILVSRTLPDGNVRYGLVGKVDLEHYDYSYDSRSKVRPTEKTVEERLPVRCRLREKAKIELPHIMVFVKDDHGLFSLAKDGIKDKEPIYDFDLMLGGGHIRGEAITGEGAGLLDSVIAVTEECDIPYAVGDGNHSLAAAKMYYEKVKTELGQKALCHPARYALCEIVSVYDDSIVFEPIYRLLLNTDPGQLGEYMKKYSSGSGFEVVMVSSEGQEKIRFAYGSEELNIAALQQILDGYMKEHPETVCDYIHDRDELIRCASERSAAGFIFPGIRKADLFGYIKEAPLPRKTFSMGSEDTKRYYLEARVIN